MSKGKFEQWEKELIKDLRDKDISYSVIGKELNRTKDVIKSYCRSNNLNGFRANDKDPNNAYSNFIKNFNKQYGDRYLYVGGYTHSDSDVIIECRQCHTQINMGMQSIRKHRPLHCECEINERRQIKEYKKSLISISNKRVKGLLRDIKLKKQKEKRDKELLSVCVECGKSFIGTSINMKYCSAECARRMNNRGRDKRVNDLFKANGNVDKDITLTKLIKRDGSICHICGDKCDRKDYTRTEEGYFIVGNNYPSIDHVIPKSKGGTHTWGNIKLAHHYCNTIKRDKEIYQEGTGQLKIVI